MGKFFCMLKFDLYEGHMINNNFFEVHPPPPPPPSFMSDFLTPSNLKALNLGPPPIIFLSIAFRAIKCTGR